MKFYDHPLHSFEEYEKSHAARFNYFYQNFNFAELKGKRIIDFGFGLGNLYSRFKDTNNYYAGVDYTSKDQLAYTPNNYYQKDLNYPFADSILEQEGMFAIGLMLETIEHISNVAGAIAEVKKLLIPDGILYLSIPTEQCNHPILYPGLFELKNFTAFLCQMAFEVIETHVHTAAFSQYVFVLRNKDWSHSKMTVDKTNEEKYRNISPFDYVNL